MVGSSWPRSLIEELTEGALAQPDLLLEDLWRAVFAAKRVEMNGTPCGGRQIVNLGKEARRTPPQGDEDDAVLVEAIEPIIRRELGIEHQVLGHSAILTLPECDEAENLVGFLALTNIGIRVAEDLSVGILGEEGENAGLAATSL